MRRKIQILPACRNIRTVAAMADVLFIQLVFSLSLITRPDNPSLQSPSSIPLPNPTHQNDEVCCPRSFLPRPPHPRSSCRSSTPPPRPHVPKDRRAMGEMDRRECLRHSRDRNWMQGQQPRLWNRLYLRSIHWMWSQCFLLVSQTGWIP